MRELEAMSDASGEQRKREECGEACLRVRQPHLLLQLIRRAGWIVSAPNGREDRVEHRLRALNRRYPLAIGRRPDGTWVTSSLYDKRLLRDSPEQGFLLYSLRRQESWRRCPMLAANRESARSAARLASVFLNHTCCCN
jgi:hypothetical protein